jgi:hypothetical protein
MIKALVDRVFADARARLVYRALLAGATVLYVADEPLSKAALVAAGWAAVEAFTPLNGLVGFLKGK